MKIKIKKQPKCEFDCYYSLLITERTNNKMTMLLYQSFPFRVERKLCQYIKINKETSGM